jgi:hypothetical protein
VNHGHTGLPEPPWEVAEATEIQCAAGAPFAAWPNT